MKELIKKEIEKIQEELYDINQYIYENPELGDKEFKAVEKLASLLADHNFVIDKGVAGRKTAFRATFDSKKEGPSIAFLCEYDALPGVGHGCGHNMIGTMGAAAGIGLSKIVESIGGKIVVLGTPAEETNGAKVDMVKKGVFEDIDLAMILHPSAGTSTESGSSQAMDAIQFEYIGKPSHAAAAPQKGINALDAVIMLFNGINALREHVTSDVRMHGIIKEGGEAANIVPEKAVAQFYIRAKERKYLDEVVEKVKNIAKGAEMMTGATVNITNYEASYDNLKTNKELSYAFSKNLKQVGIEHIEKAQEGAGSIDMGDVSLVCPAIHPYIGLDHPNVNSHSKEMADLTVTEIAKERLIQGALAMAYTGLDVIEDKDLLAKIKEEFKRNK
ncbi:M20 family metallopeptidase [Proteinivorax hydrogeniformans]|uniref:Peptidase M20 domain-containing protein 2 n=1 Tax=Proteinivorax hydrogeniformans TaxID=1826727 RepID=A0AAU8HW44_9FIRM